MKLYLYSEGDLQKLAPGQEVEAARSLSTITPLEWV